MSTIFYHVLLAICFLSVGVNLAVAAEDAPYRVFLMEYCVSCHGAKKQEADLRFDGLSDLPREELRKQWHQIQQKLAARDMPPPRWSWPVASG